MLAIFYVGLSIGVDYAFSLFLAALVLSLWWFALLRVRFSLLASLLAASLGIPFLLRQLQVASVLGRAFWWQDVRWSLLRRIPLLSALWPAPDFGTISAFYARHHVLAWPGGEAPWRPLTYAWVMARAHAVAAGWPILALAVGTLVAARWRGRIRGTLSPALTLSLAVATALLAPLVVFGPYTATFTGTYLMPLGVHWVVLLLGLASYWLWTRWATLTRPLALALLLGFILWRGGVEARNLVVLPPAGYPGREAMQAIRGSSVATLWISSAPSAYTDEWAATLQTMRWLFQGRQGLMFDPGREFYAFFERDAANPRYRTPDYLFLPRLHTPGLPRTCEPFGGAIWAFADGCSDLTYIAGRMPFAPILQNDSFLLYDLRALRKEAPHGS